MSHMVLPSFYSFKELSGIIFVSQLSAFFLWYRLQTIPFVSYCNAFLCLKHLQISWLYFALLFFLDLKRIMPIHIPLAKNFLLCNLATSDSQLNFEKPHSVSKLLVGKLVSSLAVGLSICVTCGDSLSENLYSQPHCSLIPSTASVPMRSSNSWTISLFGSSVGTCMYETRKSFI